MLGVIDQVWSIPNQWASRLLDALDTIKNTERQDAWMYVTVIISPVTPISTAAWPQMNWPSCRFSTNEWNFYCVMYMRCAAQDLWLLHVIQGQNPVWHAKILSLVHSFWTILSSHVNTNCCWRYIAFPSIQQSEYGSLHMENCAICCHHCDLTVSPSGHFRFVLY